MRSFRPELGNGDRPRQVGIGVMWTYRCKVDPENGGVIDGDTISVEVDLGFGMDGLRVRLRLLGVDTPERRTETMESFLAAKKFTADWLAVNATVEGWLCISTIKDRRDRDKADSFGRYLAVVWNMAQTVNLNDALIIAGHSA